MPPKFAPKRPRTYDEYGFLGGPVAGERVEALGKREVEPEEFLSAFRADVKSGLREIDETEPPPRKRQKTDFPSSSSTDVVAPAFDPSEFRRAIATQAASERHRLPTTTAERAEEIVKVVTKQRGQGAIELDEAIMLASGELTAGVPVGREVWKKALKQFNIPIALLHENANPFYQYQNLLREYQEVYYLPETTAKRLLKGQPTDRDIEMAERAGVPKTTPVREKDVWEHGLDWLNSFVGMVKEKTPVVVGAAKTLTGAAKRIVGEQIEKIRNAPHGESDELFGLAPERPRRAAVEQPAPAPAPPAAAAPAAPAPAARPMEPRPARWQAKK